MHPAGAAALGVATFLLMSAAVWPGPVRFGTVATGGKRAVAGPSAAPAGLLRTAPTGSAAASLVGAWSAETYHLASGEVHPLAGRIFFTQTEWQVLFFVLDADSVPRRGSAEGGDYTTEGDRLTFWHRYNLSAGDALEGLPASPLRRVVHETMTTEAARFGVDGEGLTIFFPSGNEMRFRRSSPKPSP